jgi:hypothetical protein
VQRGLATRNLHHVGLAFVGHHEVEHRLDFFEGAMAAVGGAAFGVAGGAGEVAAVRYLNHGEAGVLLVVGAEAAVVGAAVVRGHVEAPGRLAGLHVVANAFVVLDVGGDAHLLPPVLGAALEHVHGPVFKDDFGLDAPQAVRAQAQGEVVVGVRAFGHGEIKTAVDLSSTAVNKLIYINFYFANTPKQKHLLSIVC